MPVVLSLVIGVGVGSVIVWQTRFGQADNERQVMGVATTFSSDPEDQWKKPLDFDQSNLEIVADLMPVLIEQNRHVPTAEELANAERTKKLKQYFTSRKSPFADDETVQAFLDSKNMKLMIAISFVESTMGKKCYYRNCSGIGGTPPNLRKYDNYAGWVKDFDDLLERRYKGLPIEKFMGLYVQPGSPNWLNGVKQILAELKERRIE